jgi:23S rRNA (guanine745-N1)-methyltransferase
MTPPPAVPRPLAAVADLLLCPVCGDRLAPVPGGLACANGHHHDVAREGYVALLAGPVGRAAGDDGEMIAARVEMEAARHFAPLSAALVAAAPAGHGLALDVGAGTGLHLAEVVKGLGRDGGIAIDVSRAACRRVARAHPSLAVVRADVWSQIPVADGAADLALDVFAPRNGAELGRVVRPGGTLLVATPAEAHLRELRGLHRLSIQPDKPARLREQLAPWFEAAAAETVEWRLSLTAAEAASLLRMGPSARHLQPGALEELAGAPGPVPVTAAVQISAFRRADQLVPPTVA